MRGPGIEMTDTMRAAEHDEDDQRCGAAGDLIRRVLPDAAAVPRAPAWASMRQALAGPGGGRSTARTRRRRLIPALAGLALVLAALVVGRGRALRYQVDEGRLGPDGRVETAAGQGATVRFSDGTSIALHARSAGRVTARTPQGATFALERGRASFDVIHGAHARWRVAAGPFEILVTGTRFDVDWSGDAGRALEIDLHAGAVIVRGAMAGPGVALHAGQRLLARLDDQRLVVDGAGNGDGVASGNGNGSDMGAPSSVAPSSASPGVSPPVAAPPIASPVVASPSALPEAPSAAPPFAVAPADSAPDPAGAAAATGVDKRRGRRERALDEPAGAPPAAGAPVAGPGDQPFRGPFDHALSPSPRSLFSLELAAGGAACLDWAPQIRFDQSIAGAFTTSIGALSLDHAAEDHTRSWCGAGSLRADATFNIVGAQNSIKVRPHEVGSVVITLPEAVDLTGQSVTAHLYVEAPPEIQFAAQIFVVNGTKWVGGGWIPGLSPGRWLTITSQVYQQENPLFEGGRSRVDRAGGLAVQIYSLDRHRTWSGRIFLDDVGWR
jgi:ferric-dicitrate binding protein FerR (iron transport regulator)